MTLQEIVAGFRPINGYRLINEDPPIFVTNRDVLSSDTAWHICYPEIAFKGPPSPSFYGSISKGQCVNCGLLLSNKLISKIKIIQLGKLL